MSFLTLPENTIRDKHSMMFHALPVIGTAMAAGGAGILSSIGSSLFNSSSANKAASAQGKAGKEYKKQLQAATDQYVQQQNQVKKKISKINPNLKIPEFNLQNATLESINAANQITANTLQQLDTIVPGSSQARSQAMQSIGQWENNLNQQYQGIQANQGLIDQQRDVVGSMLRGELTPVQQEQINRVIAERAGAGFNPATAGRTGGFQTAQAQLADQLRQSSEQRILAGMQLAPSVNEQQNRLATTGLALSEGFRGLQSTSQNWMQLAKSFTQNVPEIMGIGLQGRGQNIQVQQYGIQNALNQQNYLSQINQGNYGALTGQAQSMYGVNKDNAAANYAAQQAIGQGFADVGKAAYGGLSGMSNAYSQLAAVQGGSGGYSTMGQAQQAAPYAENFSQVYGSYIPRATRA